MQSPAWKKEQFAGRTRAHDQMTLPSSADKAIDDEGIYLLISKRRHLISHVLVCERLAKVLPISKRDAIRDAFVEEFKKGDGYDARPVERSPGHETALGRGFPHQPGRSQARGAPGRRRTGGRGPLNLRALSC